MPSNDELVFHGQKIFDNNSGGLYQVACPTKQESAAYTYYLENRTPTYINERLNTPYKAFYGKKHEKIGCLTAQLQGMDLDGKQQYREKPVDSSDTESSDSENETILYPKTENHCERAFNAAAWRNSTREPVASILKTHNFVLIYDIGNDKSFVERIVPARSRGPIPSIPSSSARCASPYSCIYAPRADVNSLFDDICPFVDPVWPEYGSKMFNYAYSEQLCSIGYVPHPTEPCIFRRKEYSDDREGEYHPQIESYTDLGIYVMLHAIAKLLNSAESKLW